jgi:hypothetical protein
VSAFNAAIVQHVAASQTFTELAHGRPSSEAKDWTLAAKNEAQAALALVQAKKTHEVEGRR